MYPSHAKIDGVEYEINSSYEVSLRCFEIIEDEDIDDYERVIAIVTLLFGVECPITEEAYIKASFFLSCGIEQEEHKNQKEDMNFEQDAGFIRASFMSTYQIDLTKTEMHWWQFFELLQGLDNKAILSRVREIRNYDLSTIKDRKTIQDIEQSKKAVALKKKATIKQEQKKNDFLNKLRKEE